MLAFVMLPRDFLKSLQLFTFVAGAHAVQVVPCLHISYYFYFSLVLKGLMYYLTEILILIF